MPEHGTVRRRQKSGDRRRSSEVSTDELEHGYIWLVWYQDSELGNFPSYTWDVTNWRFEVSVDQTSDDLYWDLWHKTNPHGETTANHITGSISDAFDADGLCGDSASHPGDGHIDNASISLVSDGGPYPRTHIYIDVLHDVPEPATLALLSLGGLGALLRRRR